MREFEAGQNSELEELCIDVNFDANIWLITSSPSTTCDISCCILATVVYCDKMTMILHQGLW